MAKLCISLPRVEYDVFLSLLDVDSGIHYYSTCRRVLMSIHTNLYSHLHTVKADDYSIISLFDNVPDLIDYILLESALGNSVKKYRHILTQMPPEIINQEYQEIVRKILRTY